MLVVLRKNDGSLQSYYYEDWFKSENGEYKINNVFEDINGARVLKLYGFKLWFGNHPPPDEVVEMLLKDYTIVPVKIVPLQ